MHHRLFPSPIHRSNLTQSEQTLRDIDDSVDNVTQRVLLAELKVPSLRGRADRLRTLARELEENATKLQEANVDGALKLTTEAQKRSRVGAGWEGIGQDRTGQDRADRSSYSGD